ncbi:phosphoserine phosphatase SerB [Simiduia agarivorans]|uniref:Phosphoserine phosphatase n=1 Tax=Simiduia agarivorans (strain DSM 21679 / JCM 13881 / BCRC 17597 / SA1) TaxID=1117647 RepID=K4KM96_SIMAS|nr:phosphoserine phosphatase SerB [Simiduia agarivorans]AFU99188.1 phosphoserine phosphatase SerB [Simiduia agarivorans SA1 = DSM 21679]
MPLIALTGNRNSQPLDSVLATLAQLPVTWGGMETRLLHPGFSLLAECESPVEADALRESLAELLPDLQVAVTQAPSPADYVMTLMAPALNPAHQTAVLRKADELGLGFVSGRSLSSGCSAGRQGWQLQFSGQVDLAAARKALLALADNLQVDINLQPRAGFGMSAGLICFDMDSTLIKAECIDELAREAGIGERVSEITAQAMRGEIDFIESFTRRMALLNGLSESVLEGIANRLELMDGAEVLINTLKARGFHTAILSGGFNYFAEKVAARLGIHEYHANQLEIENGFVTGRVTGTVVDGKRKAELIQQIAADRGLEMANVIAVGDGANDLPMLGLAGMGVAIHAKPLVRASADYSISTLGLDGLCYLLGLEDADIIS